MSQKPYDYSTRKGVLPISWDDFHSICKGLAVAVAPFDPEIVLAISRGGHYPGTLISHILQRELYSVRLTRRVNDIPVYEKPHWLARPPKPVTGKRVLVVDEICGKGETIMMVYSAVEKLGAKEVRSAVMYAHTWGVDVPDYIGLVSDELILNPWDREIYRGGAFVPHPEYLGAFDLQGIEPGPAWPGTPPPRQIAKG
jgi:hypoxanthine phosphoribosyltransferase